MRKRKKNRSHPSVKLQIRSTTDHHVDETTNLGQHDGEEAPHQSGSSNSCPPWSVSTAGNVSSRLGCGPGHGAGCRWRWGRCGGDRSRGGWSCWCSCRWRCSRSRCGCRCGHGGCWCRCGCGWWGGGSGGGCKLGWSCGWLSQTRGGQQTQDHKHYLNSSETHLLLKEAENFETQGKRGKRGRRRRWRGFGSEWGRVSKGEENIKRARSPEESGETMLGISIMLGLLLDSFPLFIYTNTDRYTLLHNFTCSYSQKA